MRKLSKDCNQLSDRILLMRESFAQARDSEVGFTHQQARTFLAMFDESYEDALLLEAAASMRTGRASADIISFPAAAPVCVVDNTTEGD